MRQPIAMLHPFAPPAGDWLTPFDRGSRGSIALIGIDAMPVAIARAAAMLDLHSGVVPVETLTEDLPITATLVWACIDDADVPWVSALRRRADEEALPLVIQPSMSALDAVEAVFADVPGVCLLVEVDEVEAATVLARQLAVLSATVHAPSAGAELRDRQIESLQEEVQRIGRMLARLAIEPAATREPPSPFIDDHVSAAARTYHAGPASAYDGPTVTGRDVRTVIRQRRLRDELFDPELFADPAWDMLLDLYAARLDRTRVSVSSLCIAAAVPATTALRWIKTLTKTGLFERKADQHDARRIFVQLSDEATTGMHRYFARLSDPRLAV
jgi:Winged helix DNA-binding domain